ncbi:hypothetical protein [Streptomyces sp. NBC_00354]|uniref:hypothetical protein n=1 Tax=Streptomyces sp. NBC_00354 TaxID=2975723 RepID=UPI002E25D20E|nr:hypothetical protein OG296_35235 [Streptomyces sp. NBC_01001]
MGFNAIQSTRPQTLAYGLLLALEQPEAFVTDVRAFFRELGYADPGSASISCSAPRARTAHAYGSSAAARQAPSTATGNTGARPGATN